MLIDEILVKLFYSFPALIFYKFWLFYLVQQFHAYTFSEQGSLIKYVLCLDNCFKSENVKY